MPVQIVIDTNVFVSALRSNRGASFRLISLVGSDDRFEINVSVPLILEYEDAALRAARRFGLTVKDISDIVDYICSVANRRQIHFLWRPLLRDPNDDMVLEVAVEATCKYIITFNARDFGTAKRIGIGILTPGEFLRSIGEIS
jgi:putative PIN family toxin of toxin-antitoxin system